MKIAKSVNRLGTEAVYNIFAKTKKLIKEGKEVIDLSLGQSDFKSPKHAVDAAIKALKDGHHGYTLPNGIVECREAVSKKGMDDSQITGATSSYARKYAANGLFAIDDTADADSMDNRPETLINGKLPKAGHITVSQNVKLERLSRDPKFKGADMQKQVREFIDSNPTKEEADEKILKLNTMIKEGK